jgi:hypothetical protein
MAELRVISTFPSTFTSSTNAPMKGPPSGTSGPEWKLMLIHVVPLGRLTVADLQWGELETGCRQTSM